MRQEYYEQEDKHMQRSYHEVGYGVLKEADKVNVAEAEWTGEQSQTYQLEGRENRRARPSRSF